jgi:hypothetical protein
MTTYIGKYSMDPTSWVNDGPGWASTSVNTTAIPTTNGFKPVRVTTANATYGGIYPPGPTGMTEGLSVGEHLTIKAKVAPGTTPGGATINMRRGGAGSQGSSAVFSSDLTAATPTWTAASGVTLISSTKNTTDGTTEVVFRYVVQSGDVGDLQVGVSTATDVSGKQVDVWGLQVVVGDSDAPWTPVTTATIGSSVSAPWVADVHDYGAVGDAVGFNDGVLSTAHDTFSSASYVFGAGDTGKYIYLDDTTPHLITGVTGGGGAVIDPPAAGWMVSPGLRWRAGTDDTAAIQNAVAAAKGGLGAGATRATVKFRTGHGYLVSNPSGSGKPGCIVLPPGVGLEGDGEGLAQSRILTANSVSGHVICTDYTWGSTPYPLAEFFSISNLRVSCYAGDNNANQLDGVSLFVAGGGYSTIDPFNRVRKLLIENAQRHGLSFGGAPGDQGRGELLIEDVVSIFNRGYGFYAYRQDDYKVIGCSAGGNSLTGVRIVQSGPGHWIGCKAYFNGSGGQADAANSANWYVGPDPTQIDNYTGGVYFTSCEAQESRGSSWVIEAGSNIFTGTVAADPGRKDPDHHLNIATTAPGIPVIAGYHLRGAYAHLNTFNGAVVAANLANYPDNRVSTDNSPANNFGWAGYAVYIEPSSTGGTVPDHNRGSIYTQVATATTAGLTYPATGGKYGGAGTTSGSNTLLQIDGVAMT